MVRRGVVTTMIIAVHAQLLRWNHILHHESVQNYTVDRSANVMAHEDDGQVEVFPKVSKLHQKFIYEFALFASTKEILFRRAALL